MAEVLKEINTNNDTYLRFNDDKTINAKWYSENDKLKSSPSMYKGSVKRVVKVVIEDPKLFKPGKIRITMNDLADEIYLEYDKKTDPNLLKYIKDTLKK